MKEESKRVFRESFLIKKDRIVILSRGLRTLTNLSVEREKRIKPYWVTGFTESDGSFMVSLEKKKGGLGVDVVPTYALSQNISELQLMRGIKEYFGVGYIVTSRSECNYIVKGDRQLREVIIPHFDSFQLRGEKRMKYEKFKLVLGLKEKGEHKVMDGLGYIMKLTLGMNTNQFRKRREELMEKMGVKVSWEIEEPKLEKLEHPLDPEYVSGLSDGDGSFYVSIRDGRKLKPGFSIVQTGDEGEELLRLVKRFFNGVGGVYRYGRIVRYQVGSVSELIREVIPHFCKHSINTKKEGDFRLLEKVCQGLKAKKQEEIRDLLRLVKEARERRRERKS